MTSKMYSHFVCILAFFFTDNTSVFHIEPLVTNIRSNAVAKFHVYFRPIKNDKIYDIELEAYCICLNCAATNADALVLHFPVPYFLKLSLLGMKFYHHMTVNRYLSFLDY